MVSSDYNSVLERMRLSNGDLFPLPVVLPWKVDPSITIGSSVDLYDSHDHFLAELHVQDYYPADLETEGRSIFGPHYTSHPYYQRLTHLRDQWGSLYYIGGKILRHQRPSDTFSLPVAPILIGFQTRNPLHRSHIEMIQRVLSQYPQGIVLLQPAMGPTQEVDIPPLIRMRCYRHFLTFLNCNRIILSPLNLAMRMAGPREALFHALIRRNYGCTHFIVGRDHAGPSTSIKFYQPYDAQELALTHQEELGIKVIPFSQVWYQPEKKMYLSEDELTPEEPRASISGTQMRGMLARGEDLPSWFTLPEIERELKNYYQRKPYCLWLTGLSGSGKTTLARGLKERSETSLFWYDGDEIRKHLTPHLGFTREDRRRQTQVATWLAQKILQEGYSVIITLISPYRDDRAWARQQIEEISGATFWEIFVDAPLEECQRRDVKGLYQSRQSQMTGVDDPYQPPLTPDLHVKTQEETIEECIQKIRGIYPPGL